ncbi:cytochrome P450 6j1-like [Periplaneta americana]|uniref:cytochrome P450 6j1-like n=1 Tax=Periplaneta americana TaxID=6978 RepID=UPI0037E752F3
MAGCTLTYALYELALNPELQGRLREEITEVLTGHDQQVTYESIQQMIYLDMVVSETLLKYPVLGFLDRECLKDYELSHPSGKGTFTLPAGTGVYIPLLGIHRDPKYYPDPENFNPENFSKENKKARHKQAFLPFGDGPRQCLGYRFAYIQIKSGLINILSRYEVAPCEKTPVPLRFEPKSFILVPLDTLYLKFKRIGA